MSRRRAPHVPGVAGGKAKIRARDEPVWATIALRGYARAEEGPMSVDQDFAEFVGARWSALYRLAYLLTASPTGAEDLLQTSLEKAYVRWSRIGGMEYAERYVRRMIANTYISGLRRAWVGEVPHDRMPETGDSAEGALLDRAMLWPLVCALPPRQRAVIVLRFYEDMSEADIAATLGCNTGTVKSQSSAAMTTLRRSLAAAGIGEAVGEA